MTQIVLEASLFALATDPDEWPHRRALFNAALGLGATIALAACSTNQVQTAAQIAAAIAKGVAALAPALIALGLSPETTAQVQKYAGVVATVAAAIEANPSSATASQVQQLEDAVNVIIDAASQIQVLPANVRAILGALAVALPMLEAALGILLPPTPAPPAPTAAFRAGVKATVSTMTGGQIISILNGAPAALVKYRR